MSPTLRLSLVLSFSLAWFAAQATAQCGLPWSSGNPQPSLSGAAECSTLWDPDGVGPQAERLVVGGQNLVGGLATAGQRVMTWDGIQWQALGNGPGTSGRVTKLTTWNGLLVAAGTFTGGGTDRIALWNGSAWQPLGPGLPTTSVAITEWNGNLVAVAISGGVVVSVWNGATWSTLPPPPTLSLPFTAVSFQGLLCVGGGSTGSFNGALERWNGTSWLTTIPANGEIHTLAVRSFQFNNTLYAGGGFSAIGAGGTPASRIASTPGGTAFAWNAVGSGLTAICNELHVRATSALGTAVVARLNSGTSLVVQLSGSSFVGMGTVLASSLAYYGGSYHATEMGNPADACLRYDGINWLPVRGQGLDGEVRSLAPVGSDMIVGGTIQSTAGAALNRIARWNGTAFQPLGTGMGGVSVDALLTLANGDVVAGGLFTTAGGMSISNIARWNGSAWSGFGSGCDQQVLALCRMPNGDLVAGGRFAVAGGVACARVARWNGSTWSPLGFGMNGDVLALALRGDGTLFAGGAFTASGAVSCSRIAQWNGSAWQPVGTGCNADVHALAVRPNNDVVAVGAFTTAGSVSVDGCARWTGTTWVGMGANSGDPGFPRAVLALPDGDVVAGRGFHQPTANPDAGIARWNGTTWSGFDTGLALAGSTGSVTVRALAQRADGALIVGGTFGIAGGLVARGLAALTSTCPASATPYGAGCNSSAGPIVLVAETLPWIGATQRTVTTGIAPGSLCFRVLGFAQRSIPLPSLLPQGQPGCTLLVSANNSELRLPDGAGAVRTALALPRNMSLVGLSFVQQTVAIELDASGALTAVRSSNGLAATIGTL